LLRILFRAPLFLEKVLVPCEELKVLHARILSLAHTAWDYDGLTILLCKVRCTETLHANSREERERGRENKDISVNCDVIIII
jgi:hypothetical protein